MKNTKMMAKMFTVMLFIAATLTTSNTSAQAKTKKATMKDCCMMKDGKMMVIMKYVLKNQHQQQKL